MAAAKHRHKGKSHLSHQAMQRLMLGAGGDVVRVWTKASPRQREILKHRAGRQGVTIAGLIQGGPLALRERSPKGIRQEAKRRITTAYGPAQAELDDREKRTLSLDTARQHDEEAFRNWRMTQEQRLAAASEAATSALEGTLHGLADETRQLYAGADQQVKSNVASQPGTGDVSGADTGLAAQGQHDVGSILVSQVAAARDRRQGTQASADLQENTIATESARSARRVSETSAALADIARDRKETSAAKAADVAKEIARLSDTEIQKAQSNREFGAALDKLGIDRAKLGADIHDDKVDNRAKRRDQRLKQIDQKLKSKTLGETKRHHLEQEKAELIRANKSGSDSGGGTNRFGKTDKEASANRGTFQNIVYRLRFGSLSKQMANSHPLLARAAAAWIKKKPLDRRTIKGIQKVYGFTPPHHKRHYFKSPSLTPRNPDGTPG